MLASGNKLHRGALISPFCTCEVDNINGVLTPDLNSCLNSAMATCKAFKIVDWRCTAKAQGCFQKFQLIKNRGAFKLNEQTYCYIKIPFVMKTQSFALLLPCVRQATWK